MDEHVVPLYRRAEEVLVAGDGAVVRDADGREFLDFLGGIAVSALGHGHPELVAALREQAGQLLHVSNLYRHPYTEQVAGLVAELTGLEAVYFANSGAEAVEAALKIARKHHTSQGQTDRTGFVSMEGSFHGRTLGALSVTHAAAYRAPFEPLIPGVDFVSPGDEAALEAALNRRPAALILEPIQGENGVLELPTRYLQAARRLCDQTGTLLIHDEVQCGAGRTGTFLAADHADVKPDIVTLAKPIAAGLPMGLTVVNTELAATLQPGDHGSTFAGGPLACRAALVLLTALQSGLQQDVVARGDQLRAGLEQLAGDHDLIVEVRGRGLMQAIRLSSGAPALQRSLHQRGLLANCTAGDVVRFLPPYVITPDEIDRGLALIDAAIRDLEEPRS